MLYICIVLLSILYIICIYIQINTNNITYTLNYMILHLLLIYVTISTYNIRYILDIMYTYSHMG